MPYRHGHVTDHDPPEQGLKPIITVCLISHSLQLSPTTIHQNKD